MNRRLEKILKREILLFFSFAFILLGKLCYGKIELSSFPMEKGYLKIPFVSQENIFSFVLKQKKEKKIGTILVKLEQKFKLYHWQFKSFKALKWQAFYKTNLGHPLLYKEFGNGQNTTLILSGVHADELSAIHLGFKLIDYLVAHPEIYQEQNIKIIVAPLVNPDGFFRKVPLRTNGQVDLNRNFLTQDWFDQSKQSKKSKKARYFPGFFPNTEIETIFQKKLLQKFKPHKILSIHAPLNFLDYDGPLEEVINKFTQTKKNQKNLVYKIAKKSKHKVVNFETYPGSLGNYAGKERNVPTVTLELDSSFPNKKKKSWKKFIPGLTTIVTYNFNRT